MKSLGEFIHGLDLKYGLYSSAGTKTCQGLPGGLDHEIIDAMDYASWEVDYLKYDNCFNQGRSSHERYTAMSDALLKSGRPIFYSVCNWGNEEIGSWGNTIANSWRTTQDIEIYHTVHNQWQQIKSNFIQNQLSSKYASKGHWNDPDMLQIGNELLNLEEEQTHFALWAYAKAPLIIGCDLEKISDDSLAILKNAELIAINQDNLGYQAECVVGCDFDQPTSVFKQTILTSENVYIAVLVVNWDDENNQSYDLNLIDQKIALTAGDNCSVTYSWTGETADVKGSAVISLTDIKPHGNQSLRIKCLPF
uniref:Alpha-galactosidase n=1 Tax=Strombidium rassoulzadegani TaxID=1082188 RepID=A0A7S3CQM4_9SPIT|mmetsp:Transcript_3395/g.5724  ORF Transcript_3395/g.5724 Transcript_3395/m.5724 type:complete len:307 (+) Transcript_3395:289-1209(+)